MESLKLIKRKAVLGGREEIGPEAHRVNRSIQFSNLNIVDCMGPTLQCGGSLYPPAHLPKL